MLACIFLLCVVCVCVCVPACTHALETHNHCSDTHFRHSFDAHTCLHTCMHACVPVSCLHARAQVCACMCVCMHAYCNMQVFARAFPSARVCVCRGPASTLYPHILLCMCVCVTRPANHFLQQFVCLCVGDQHNIDRTSHTNPLHIRCTCCACLHACRAVHMCVCVSTHPHCTLHACLVHDAPLSLMLVSSRVPIGTNALAHGR